MKINDYQHLIERADASYNQLRTSVRGKNLAVKNAFKTAATRPPMPPIERNPGGGDPPDPPPGTPDHLGFLYDPNLPGIDQLNLMDRVLEDFNNFLTESMLPQIGFYNDDGQFEYFDSNNDGIADIFEGDGTGPMFGDEGWQFVIRHPPGDASTAVVLRYSPQQRCFFPATMFLPGGFQVQGIGSVNNNMTRTFLAWINGARQGLASVLMNQLLPMLFGEGFDYDNYDPEMLPLITQDQIVSALRGLEGNNMLAPWIVDLLDRIPDGYTWEVYLGESMTNPGAPAIPGLGFRLVGPEGPGVSIGAGPDGRFNIIGGNIMTLEQQVRALFGPGLDPNDLFDLMGGLVTTYGDLDNAPGSKPGVDPDASWLQKIRKYLGKINPF